MYLKVTRFMCELSQSFHTLAKAAAYDKVVSRLGGQRSPGAELGSGMKLSHR